MPKVKLQLWRSPGWGPQDPPATLPVASKGSLHGNPFKDSLSTAQSPRSPRGSAGEAYGLVKWHDFAAPAGSSIPSMHIKCPSCTADLARSWAVSHTHRRSAPAVGDRLLFSALVPGAWAKHNQTFFSFLNVLPGGLVSLPQDGY